MTPKIGDSLYGNLDLKRSESELKKDSDKKEILKGEEQVEES